MGTTAHVVVVGGTFDHLERARRRIGQLERRWSRFLPDSEVSAINAADGLPLIVSHDTTLLVERSLQAWRATDGRFDPTVHDAVIAAGYDGTFAGGPVPATLPSVEPAPGLRDVAVDRDTGLVWLPSGVHFDPGGIGKGLAADLVVSELRATGVAGACVNLGGDLRVDGMAPRGDSWSVAIDDPRDRSRELTRVPLTSGGIATSSRLDRSWEIDGLPAHHLVDPTSGRPADTDIVAVTAVAATAWWAEVTATWAFLGDGQPHALGATEVLLVTADGTTHSTRRLTEVAACPAA
jgi:thiamine biosynthesis lipoprotein